MFKHESLSCLFQLNVLRACLLSADQFHETRKMNKAEANKLTCTSDFVSKIPNKFLLLFADQLAYFNYLLLQISRITNSIGKNQTGNKAKPFLIRLVGLKYLIFNNFNFISPIIPLVRSVQYFQSMLLLQLTTGVVTAGMLMLPLSLLCIGLSLG